MQDDAGCSNQVLQHGSPALPAAPVATTARARKEIVADTEDGKIIRCSFSYTKVLEQYPKDVARHATWRPKAKSSCKLVPAMQKRAKSRL